MGAWTKGDVTPGTREGKQVGRSPHVACADVTWVLGEPVGEGRSLWRDAGRQGRASAKVKRFMKNRQVSA